MAKLSQFKNPFSGNSGDLTNPKDWVQGILGVGFLLVIFNVGQKLANYFTSKVPGENVGTGFEKSPWENSPAPTAPKKFDYGV